jgi:hypothetical protein
MATDHTSDMRQAILRGTYPKLKSLSLSGVTTVNVLTMKELVNCELAHACASNCPHTHTHSPSIGLDAPLCPTFSTPHGHAPWPHRHIHADASCNMRMAQLSRWSRST